jgi:beta-lactamase class A
MKVMNKNCLMLVFFGVIILLLSLSLLLATGSYDVNYPWTGDVQPAKLDSRLEAKIDRYIKSLRQGNTLSVTDRTSFVVYDISMQKKVVSINEDDFRMAASLIKNFVMLAYFHQVKYNRLQHTNTNRIHLRRMIQNSSNSSTNYFIRLLGGPSKVTRILTHNYSYFDRTRIVEYIPSGGRTYRNMTSAHDLNRFYNQLWLGNLPYSDKMKYYLGLPNRDRIYTDTCIPQGVKVYDKTGTVYGMVGDSGILVIKDPKGSERAYAFTGMIEDRTRTRSSNRTQSFSSWVSTRCDILRRVSEGVYEYIYEVHYGGNFRSRRNSGMRIGS